MKQPERDESRLPAWARTELQRLRANLAESKELNKRMDSAEGTRVTLGYPERPQGRERYITDVETIFFHLATGQRIGVHLDENARAVIVQGTRYLSIHPRAANAFELRDSDP